MVEREKNEKGSEFMGSGRPNNGNKYELSCNSNFSEHPNTCIWIRHGTHPKFELIFQNGLKSGEPNIIFFVWDPVILDSNHKITIWILCTKRPPTDLGGLDHDKYPW